MKTAEGIILEEAGVKFADRQILAPLTLSLSEQRIGILGRNGSGKSTLARLMCGLIAPSSGSVSSGGSDLYTDRRAALGEVGILFQNPDHQIIFPTCLEEVAFGLAQQGHSNPNAKALAALTQFGKHHWAERPVSELSQGQRHLLCLISVLAMQPRTVILDEPFAGLDIPTTRALHATLAALPQRVIHITHDPAALSGYDRALWLEAGQVHADGPAAQVLPRFIAAMQEASDDCTDLAG